MHKRQITCNKPQYKDQKTHLINDKVLTWNRSITDTMKNIRRYTGCFMESQTWHLWIWIRIKKSNGIIYTILLTRLKIERANCKIKIHVYVATSVKTRTMYQLKRFVKITVY